MVAVPAVELEAPPRVSALPSTAAEIELDRLLVVNGIHSVYQPIVELDSGATVAYEALARAPRGTALERPDLLFAAARQADRLAEVDGACQDAAVEGATRAGLCDPFTLFVNVEPVSAAQTLAEVTSDEPRRPGAVLGFPIVVELTERALIADPIELLALVARIRARGWGIALDDVGAHPDSLALLPLLRPDVIKLDLSLVQQRPSAEIARVVSAVNAEAERSGSAVLAEGIETERHLDVALGLGASLGQGFMLGRPAPLPALLPTFAGSGIRLNVAGGGAPTRSPFELVSEHRRSRLSRKSLLIEMSKHLEAQAISAGHSTVVLATFQKSAFFTPATRRRYARLADRTAFVGALGQNMPAEPLAGVRGSVLSDDDPLIGEWDIAVVGPHYAAALVARDLGKDVDDGDREFEFLLTYDRQLVIQVALALMSRVWPKP